jgi:cell division protein FtsN
MRKKNKKVSNARKPFWVLSRRAVFGWLAVLLFICGWMFAIGVIVGRDDLPDAFDINPLHKELAPLREKIGNEGAGQVSKKTGAGNGKTGLDFYEALPEDREDSTITAKPRLPEPKAEVEPQSPAEDKDKAAPGKKAVPKTKRSMKRLTKVRVSKKDAVDPPQSPTSAPAKSVKSTGNTYTIQVAAFKQAGDADKLVAKLKRKGFLAYRALGKVPGKGIWYRVRIGEFKDKAEASKAMANLKKQGHKSVLVEK